MPKNSVDMKKMICIIGDPKNSIDMKKTTCTIIRDALTFLFKILNWTKLRNVQNKEANILNEVD